MMPGVCLVMIPGDDCRVQPTEWLQNGLKWTQTTVSDAREDPGVLPWQKWPYGVPY